MTDLFSEIFPITTAALPRFESMLAELEAKMRQAMAKSDLRVQHARVIREPKLQTWLVADRPSLSLSIFARLLAEQNVADYARTLNRNSALIGLAVTDKTSSVDGEIIGITGKMAQYREHLLELTGWDVMQAIIRAAPDDEPIVQVRVGSEVYDYPASALDIVIRTGGEYDDLERFEVDARPARRALRMKPESLSPLVKVISDIGKEAGLLENAFNGRENPELFLQLDFEANLKFDKNRGRPYSPETLGNDFAACGVYQRHKAFEAGPVRIAAINTLDDKIDDFMEAMKRQLERAFGFTIELIRERKVKVPSRKNLAGAVKKIIEEEAHIVLVFVPDDDQVADETTADYLKSLVIGQGIASHVIFQSTFDDPDAMATVIMGLLGKTGNVPFVLAEPVDYADFIIGLDMVHEQRAEGDYVTAIARIYRSDGMFVRYAVGETALETENMLYVLVRDLLPQREFAKKRVIIHHQGPLNDMARHVLLGWGKAIGATFSPVEIMTDDVPHLYALEGRQITRPGWGSVFRLNDEEALLVSSLPDDAAIPQPLHVRTTAPLTIEQALYSALVWTLLRYGATNHPRLPVTIQYSQVIGQWLEKGIMPKSQGGTTPFWL